MKYILGIDENGLGFTNQSMIGPLIVTATGFEIEGDIFPLNPPFVFENKILVCDSKDLFKRASVKSYITGEITSICFLSILKKNDTIKNFDNDIFNKFNINNPPCKLRKSMCFFKYPLNLPLWSNSFPQELIKSLEVYLAEKNIKFIYCKFAVLCPYVLYKKNKYTIETIAIGRIIKDWLNKIKNKNNRILVGNIRNYTKKKIEKCWKENNLLFDTNNVEFIKKGDKTEFPISLSSIIGKYIREIFIKRINEYFYQYDNTIPFCAGYRQNQTFDIFIEKVKTICKQNNISLSCLVRDYIYDSIKR